MKTIVTPARVCGRKFLKNNWNEPVKENTDSVCFQRSNSSFQVKIKSICHYELDSFPILKDLSHEISGDVNERNLVCWNVTTFGRSL